MSLVRAMTRRTKRTEAPSSSPLTRSLSVKPSISQIDRAKISLPVALVSTTNMLSYEAPDIATMRHVSSSTASSHSSAEDSDHSVSTGRSRASTVGSTLTDASSVESSPTSPAPNHLSGYFPSAGKQVRKSASIASLHNVKEATVESAPAVPAVPQRAVSHSKRAHERLAAKRSISNLNARSSTGSQRNSREQRSSVDMFSATIQEEAHPFGRELAQLNEIVEEFGGAIRDAEAEADMSVMRSRNLAAYCAADYMSDIQPLFNSRFGFPQQVAAMAWI
jgi:ribosomal protein L32